jgi:cleavage stimulation factor subunit 3
MNGNGTIGPPEIKLEDHEIENSSDLASMKSPPTTSSSSSGGPIKSIPGRSSAAAASSLDVLPDSSRATSHSSTPDVYTVKSPTADRPSLSPPIISAPARNPLASLQSAKRKRLPQDKVGQLEDRIALDARDADAWLALIGEHQAKGKISDARNTYERFFKSFPDLVLALIPSRLIFLGLSMEELCRYGIDRRRI